jgi:hypothetical protein
MSQYNVAGAKNVTMIDELMDLDDLEKSGPTPFQGSGSTIRNSLKNSNYPDIDQHSSEKFQKFIRKAHSPSFEAGMAVAPQQSRGLPSQQYQEMQVPLHSYSPPQSQQFTSVEGFNQPQSTLPKFHNLDSSSPSCLNVAEHINGCPLCSKFYNNDKTIYIITIVVLAVICILLLKRVLDV